MAYSKKPTYSFETSASVGINKVPSGRVVLVDDYEGRPQAFMTFGDLSTLQDDTTIAQAIEKGFLSRFDTHETSVARGILTPGELGFGCGVASDTLATELKLTGMPGFRDPTSVNYGNYWDANKNVFVFIPKFYFKWERNTVFVSPVEKEGYVIHRAFINAGKEIEGFFIGKYQFSFPNNKAASVQGSVWNEQQGYRYLEEANKLGDRYTIINMFMFNALAVLTKAQRQNGRNCAWMDVAPYYPKGNNNNGRDINDQSVFYIFSKNDSNHTAYQVTGSGIPFAKTTHNGQNCGVCDINGNTWEFALGMTSEGTKYFVPKLETDMTKFTHNVKNGANTDEQCAWGDNAYLSNSKGFFEELNITGTVYTSAADIHYVFGKGDEQVIPFNATKGSDHWKLSCLGVPFMAGATQGTSGGSEEFGNDCIYYAIGYSGTKINHLIPRLGGHFSNAAGAGVFAQDLLNHRTASNQPCSSRLAII